MKAITLKFIRVNGKESKCSTLTFRSYKDAEAVYNRNVKLANDEDEIKRVKGWKLYTVALIGKDGKIKKQFNNQF